MNNTATLDYYNIIDNNINDNKIIDTNKAKLVFEDGSIFTGDVFGYEGIAVGEIIFNTAMSGYQEIITDPSYYGQIIIFTFPHFGITDPYINHQSKGVYLAGIVISECDSNNKELNKYLKNKKVVGICNLDTRALTLKVREEGVAQVGIFSNTKLNDEEMVEFVILNKEKYKRDLCKDISKNALEIYNIAGNKNIVLLDFGVKDNIIKNLVQLNSRVIVLPYNSKYKDIKVYNPEKIVISNGPGDPKYLTQSIESIKDIIADNIPLLGICLGAQLIALSLNYKLIKLKYGHHSNNHPVIDLDTKRSYITTHNHNYSIDEKSLDNRIDVNFRSLNDNSIEGFRLKNIIATQFHPEAGSGSNDCTYIFKEFIDKY